MAAEQSTVDAVPDGGLHLRLSGEQDSHVHLAAQPFSAAVMRRERAGRLVVPPTAQGDGDRRSRGPQVGVRRVTSCYGSSQMKGTLTIRLDEEVRTRLERRAEDVRIAPTALAQQLLDEGLRMAAHPGIVFRPTAGGGRLPGLVAGPDVAEVIEVLTGLEAAGEQAVAEAGRWLRLHPQHVRTAVTYYAAFPDEVDREIAFRQRAADEARARWERQETLLG